jgi:hypothetical protein
MSRTTFFIVERVGVHINGIAADQSVDRARALELWERCTPNASGHRAGHWSQQALERLAQRMGGTLKSAYSVDHDGKGFFARREIVVA